MSLSPMMRQYMTIKEQFANAILFFRQPSRGNPPSESV